LELVRAMDGSGIAVTFCILREEGIQEYPNTPQSSGTGASGSPFRLPLGTERDAAWKRKSCREGGHPGREDGCSKRN